jgi:RNA polymerase sigma-70 factor (ECF subfamily)
MRFVTTWSAVQRFERWRAEVACLARARDPADLVVWLTHPGGDLDAKDAVYAALLARLRGSHADAPLARALLWLGLWPGIDAVFRRVARRSGGEHGASLSEVAHRFSELIARLDPERARRVAAGLVRGTERDAMAALRRASRERACHRDLFEDVAMGAVWNAPREGPAALHRSGEVEAVRRWLTAACGADAELVYRVVVLEENQREVGAALGLSHEAARKRVQRALARLRDRLKAG